MNFIEITEFSSVFKHINSKKKTVALIDIDETIYGFVPVSLLTLGKHVFDNHASFHQKTDEIYLNTKSLFPNNQPRALEPDTTSCLRELEKKVTHLFLLTARHAESVSETESALKERNLLPEAALPATDGVYKVDNHLFYAKNHIIYTNHCQEKGVVARDFLRKNNINYENLVFVDNNLSCAISMIKEFNDKEAFIFYYTRSKIIDYKNHKYTTSIQAKFLLHRNAVVDDFSVRIFLEKVRAAKEIEHLENTLSPETDCTDLMSFFFKHSYEKELTYLAN